MSKAEQSKTLTTLALALMAGFYLLKMSALLHGAFALIVLAAFPNPLSALLARGWLSFSELLGKVNSKVVLTLVYFVVLVPVSLCYRRFNRKNVDYFAGDGRDTFFLDSGSSYHPDSFEKTW